MGPDCVRRRVAMSLDDDGPRARGWADDGRVEIEPGAGVDPDATHGAAAAAVAVRAAAVSAHAGGGGAEAARSAGAGAGDPGRAGHGADRRPEPAVASGHAVRRRAGGDRA